jgi:hypothetical protein
MLEGPTEYVNARWMKSLHGFLHGIEWIMFHGHLYYFQKPPLGGRSNTKPGDYDTPNTHNRWFIWFYHVWGPAWIETHWNNIWLRARSHITSHDTRGLVTTLHDFGGVLGRPLEPFLWALTIPWSQLLARVWSGPYVRCGPYIRGHTVLLGRGLDRPLGTIDHSAFATSSHVCLGGIINFTNLVDLYNFVNQT